MAEQKKLSNAQRFIQAYNTIDQTLRDKHNFRRSMGFSDMIRKAVVVDFMVRKYEDELIDYGRLRNAIIHKSNEDFLIAEPHEDVVVEFEKIADLISAPPKAWNTVCTKDVFTVEAETSLREVIKLIYDSGYSNLPVYKNGGLIGVANGQKILDYIGSKIGDDLDIDDLSRTTPIEEVVAELTEIKYYEVVSIDVTIEEALNLFFKNRKLLIILLTKTGNMNEVPLGILTPSDIMDMNKIIDTY